MKATEEHNQSVVFKLCSLVGRNFIGWIGHRCLLLLIYIHCTTANWESPSEAAKKCPRLNECDDFEGAFTLPETTIVKYNAFSEVKFSIILY